LTLFEKKFPGAFSGFLCFTYSFPHFSRQCISLGLTIYE
jgi:hypothetical protein